jgi:hypothetical protein
MLDAGRAAGDLRTDVTAEDIAASLIGIFTVARPPEHEAQAARLLNILMDGLRPSAYGQPEGVPFGAPGGWMSERRKAGKRA